MANTETTVHFGTTQPTDWADKFKRQASLEGLTLSEWVGLACLDRLACVQGKRTEEIIDQFSRRVPRGRAAGTKMGGAK